MKKVSEVKKELEALGCNEEPTKNLLIACGILEDDTKPKGIEVGAVLIIRDLDSDTDWTVTVKDIVTDGIRGDAWKNKTKQFYPSCFFSFSVPNRKIVNITKQEVIK